MALTVGTHLGVYEVTAQIGEGGMGQVFRARDTKLNRNVALKIIPDAFASDPDRLARFTREAQTLASLNHPNISAIYGVEESQHVRALVMELVEGEDLSQRITRGAIPLDEALPIAKQMAEALETAHEQGIIHRDLKPANVKVREDGTVKVLDFGLAKAFNPAAASSAEVMNSPTRTSPARTELGIVLGTAAYMAPEQARGAVVDKRADIWAFGVVLFEMLTGRRLFAGGTPSDTVASVLRQHIDFGAVPATTPPDVFRLLRRCLERDPKLRLRDIGEARVLLGSPDTVASDAAIDGPQDAAKPIKSHARLAWTGGILAIAGIIALAIPVIRYLRAGDVDAPEERWQVVTPATAEPDSFAISPDGLRLVFSAAVDGKTLLWIKLIQSVTAQPLVGTGGGRHPFWSPDSHAIGFFADGKLKWIDAAGGPAHTLASANQGQGGSWNQDGEILFAPHVSEQLYRISISSPDAAPVAVTQLQPPAQTGHMSPWFLPDGRHFLYRVDGDAGGIYVGALGSSDGRRLTRADGAAVYVPPGFLIFPLRGTLVAQRFDLDTLTLTGATSVVAESPSYRGGGLRASLATGTLVYRSSSGAACQLTWVNRTGQPIARVGDPHDLPSVGLDLSPDDTQVVLDRGIDGSRDILLLETMRVGAIRLTDDPKYELSPVWSHDGQRVAFNSNRSGAFQIFERAANGSGIDKVLLPSSQTVLVPEDWSDAFLLYRKVDASRDLWVLPVSAAGPGQPFPVVNTRFEEREGQFSPNGKWIAYASNQLGHSEIYAQPFPGTEGAKPVSSAGGSQPRWRSDGKELFYIALDNQLMAVQTTFGSNGQSLQLGPPEALFASRIADPGPVRTHLYAVASDGQRFLIEQTTDEGTATLTVVRNWRPAK